LGAALVDYQPAFDFCAAGRPDPYRRQSVLGLSDKVQLSSEAWGLIGRSI
jgi:hypothetical protein